MHFVVTGASSGIGSALARAFAVLPDARLTLVARREAKLRALAEELRVPTRVVPWDLSVPERAAAWLPDAVAAQGAVDVLVNNAGAQVVAPTASTDVEAAEATLRLDLLTPLRLTHAVLPDMLARGSGTVVDVASMAALAPTPGMTWYNAAKGGLAAASEALRGELLGSGVHVVTVYPGIIETEMAERALDRYAPTRLLALQPRRAPEDLAAEVVRAVQRRRPRVIFPRSYALTRWFPVPVRWAMDRLSPPVLGGAA